MSERKLYWYYKIRIFEKRDGEDIMIAAYNYQNEPTKKQIEACLDKQDAKYGNYADVLKVASINEPCYNDNPKVWLSPSDIKPNKDRLEFYIIDPSNPEAIPYEGGMDDPRQRDWYFLVALVKIAVRNNLKLQLHSDNEAIDAWANDYLKSYM